MRFLGEYDNVLLGHADRRRILPEDFPWRAMLAPGRFATTCSSMACCGRCEGSSERESAARRWPSAPSGRSLRTTGTRWPRSRRTIDFAAADAKVRDVRFEAAVP